MMKDEHYPAIGFGLDYANQLIYCEVIMRDNYYDVLFNGELTASIAHNVDWDWLQTSGVILNDETIAEIGLKIERYYQ
ncbi:hypothetical protein [Mucilaginibacter agri]|uniref:Uncharacterized protein n=1 Tax=Mucilaginibacter agri TaxID=2695265 RepID=A0A965ZDT6_9SPHI|nr:hypothetical protein [Mucilaginibacter agri]NCD68262.1 hypothetical protein [Mucilaginibacter agri]